jgi:hypothetical protein
MSVRSLTPLRRKVSAFRANWHKLIEKAWDPYRPEPHYMRGPGPKWRAKHGPTA